VGGSRILIRVLGPVSVGDADGSGALRGVLACGFLAVVASESPRPVSVDRLTSLLWGDDPPAGVKAAVQQLATRVRRALAACDAQVELQAVPPGYALVGDVGWIDVRSFRSNVRAGADALRAGDHHRAAELLGQGLDLWVGTAFADLAELPLYTILGPVLDDERWHAEELRADALLGSGQAEECARLLAAATSQTPLRERLWVLQARSLAAAGRVADAIRCVRTGAAVITAELGVPPGPELAAMEEELLRTPVPVAPSWIVAKAPMTERGGLLDAALGRAMDNAEQAANAASQRLAHAEAVRHWQRAVELLESCRPDDDEHRLRLLLGLGAAHNTASRDAEAQRVFLQALELARRLDDARSFAWAALGYCSERNGFVVPPEHRQLLEEALRKMPSDEAMLRGRVLARLATDVYWSGAIDDALRLAEDATVEADRAGDEEGQLLARYAMAFGCWTPDRAVRLSTVAEEYLGAAQSAGSLRHQLLAHRWMAPVVTELGDVRRGAAEAKIAVEIADEIGLSEQQWLSRLIAAAIELVAGDLTKAEALATESLTLGSVTEPAVALDYFGIFIWTLRWLQGRLEEIAPLVEEVATTPGVDLTRRLGLALTHGEMGRLDDARAILDGVTSVQLNAYPKDSTWYITLAAMAEAAAATGHRRAAAAVFERLRPYHDRIAIANVTATGPVAHHVGIAAWTAGNRDVGLRMLTDAVDIGDRAPAPVFAARSRIALAERLAMVGERDWAMILATQAHDAAGRLGLRRVAADADRLLAGADPATAR
jgi:DNA-binding SARP family transcriptional activator